MQWFIYKRLVLAANVIALIYIMFGVFTAGGTLPARAAPADATATVVLIVLYVVANLVAVGRSVQSGE